MTGLVLLQVCNCNVFTVADKHDGCTVWLTCWPCAGRLVVDLHLLARVPARSHTHTCPGHRQMAGPAPAAMPVGSSPAAFAEAIVDSVLKKANKAPRVKSAQQQELVPVFMNVDYVKEPQERHVREVGPQASQQQTRGCSRGSEPSLIMKIVRDACRRCCGAVMVGVTRLVTGAAGTTAGMAQLHHPACTASSARSRTKPCMHVSN